MRAWCRRGPRRHRGVGERWNISQPWTGELDSVATLVSEYGSRSRGGEWSTRCDPHLATRHRDVVDSQMDLDGVPCLAVLRVDSPHLTAARAGDPDATSSDCERSGLTVQTRRAGGQLRRTLQRNPKHLTGGFGSYPERVTVRGDGNRTAAAAAVGNLDASRPDRAGWAHSVHPAPAIGRPHRVRLARAARHELEVARAAECRLIERRDEFRRARIDGSDTAIDAYP